MAVDVEQKMELMFVKLGAVYYGMWQSMIYIYKYIIQKNHAVQTTRLASFCLLISFYNSMHVSYLCKNANCA